MENQPYIYKKQIISLACLGLCLILCRNNRYWSTILLFIFFVLLSITFSPLIYKNFKISIWVHSLIYYFPMYISVVEYPFLFFNYKKNDIIVYLTALILLILLILWNKKTYFESIFGLFSCIPMKIEEGVNKLFSYFLAIISEELFFRGYLIYKLKEEFDLLGVIILSSLLFLVAHSLNRWANKMFDVKRYLSIYFLGLILSTVFYFTNSIIPCVLLHAIYNSANFILVVKRMGLAKRCEKKIFDDY